MNRIVVGLIAMSPLVALGDMALVSNVYVRAHGVYAEAGESAQSGFHDALGGGILNACSSGRFMAFRDYVTNHCDEIVTDWVSYETNDLVRFTTQCAIGYSCFEMQTNLAHKVLSLYEANTNSIGWGTIEMLASPDGYPDVEHYLELHYDSPGVSNIIVRLKAIAIQRNENKLREYCDSLFTGEPKREYLEMKACGAL